MINPGVEQIHRCEQSRRATQTPQPLPEDGVDVARHIDLRQCAVDLQPVRRIIARQRKGIGFERQVFGEHRELARVLGLRGQSDKLDLVARVRIDRTCLEHRHAFQAVGNRNHGRVDRAPRELAGEPRFRRRALQDRDLLSAHLGDLGDRRVGLDQEAAAVHEYQVRKIDRCKARLCLRGIGAFEVGLARGNHLDALGRAAHHPIDLEVGLADGAPDLGDDALAQVDRIAGGLIVRRDPRERERVAGKCNIDDLGGLDLAERVRCGLRVGPGGSQSESDQ